MHRVAYLVQAVLFRLRETTVRIKCIALKKIADLVTRLLKVLVAQLRLFHRGKDVLVVRRVVLVDEAQRMFAQPLTLLDRYEVLQNQDAGFLIVSHHGRGQMALGRGCICR